MTQIKFGTSGWRGILAEDFTLENVRIVTQAIADFLHADKSADKGVVIGHDSRFMGDKFAREFYISGAPTPRNRAWYGNKGYPGQQPLRTCPR